MMLNSFQNYIKLGKIKQKTPDPEEAKALLKQAVKRLNYAKTKKITLDNAPFVLGDAYEAAREAAQSLMSIHGFKPYSHEGTISFLKEFYENYFNEETLSLFNHFRQLRHDLVYKAKPVFADDAQRALLFSGKCVRIVQKITIESFQNYLLS